MIPRATATFIESCSRPSPPVSRGALLPRPMAAFGEEAGFGGAGVSERRERCSAHDRRVGHPWAPPVSLEEYD